MSGITKELVEKYQDLWGRGIVEIGRVFIEKGDYTKRALEHIQELYAYGSSPVLFKPTKAKADQFRDTVEKALSYFVATNGVCSEDKGFAIQPWTNVRFENHAITIHGQVALAMGNYYFTDTTGKDTKVEYTFGYIADGKGGLKINLHHSSVPYSG
jgi:hypothetical protein